MNSHSRIGVVSRGVRIALAAIPRALLLALLALTGHAHLAHAQFYDARGMGMGGVSLPSRGGETARVNPAYRTVPPMNESYGKSFALPIGLIQALADAPTFDSSSDDFDLIEVADFVWNFPWALQIGRVDPDTGDIVIDVSQSAVRLDLGAARDRVPVEGFDSGDYRSLFELGHRIDLGRRYGLIHLGLLEVWELDEIDLELDDALVGVLRDADPVVGDTDYRSRATGRAAIGLSHSVVYAREVSLPLSVDSGGDDWLASYWGARDDRPRLWMGLGIRRYHGLAAVGLNGELGLRGADPLLLDTTQFDLDFESEYTTAAAGNLSELGRAWGLDLGAVLRWRRFEFGAGVADLFADLTWKGARVERWVYDDVLEDMVLVEENDDATLETSIPESWRLNGLFRPDARSLVAVEIQGGPGGSAFHAGGERWVHPRLALRGGLERDRRQKWQLGGGIGVRQGSIGLDLGIRSHSRSVSDKRLLEVGIAFVWGATPIGFDPGPSEPQEDAE